MPKKTSAPPPPQVYRTIFISRDVGKHLNMSKKKVQWGLFYDGAEHVLFLKQSLISGKKEIYLDKRTIFQDSSLLSFSFEQHLIVGRYPALLEGHYADKNVTHQLTINGQLYGLLPYLNRAQVKKMTHGIPIPAESLYDLAPGETLSMYDSSASLIDPKKLEKVLAEESDEDEDETRMTPKPIRRTSATGIKKRTKSNATKKIVKKHQDDDDDDVPSDNEEDNEDDNEEEEEEEEEEKPKKKPVAKKVVKEAGAKKVPANDMEASELEAQRKRQLELEKLKKQDAFGFTDSSNGFGIVEAPPAPQAPKEEEVDELFEDIPSDLSKAKKQKEKEAKGELAFIDDLF